MGQDSICSTGSCSLLGQKREDEEERAIRELEDMLSSHEVPMEKYQSSGTLVSPSKTLIF